MLCGRTCCAAIPGGRAHHAAHSHSWEAPPMEGATWGAVWCTAFVRLSRTCEIARATILTGPAALCILAARMALHVHHSRATAVSVLMARPHSCAFVHDQQSLALHIGALHTLEGQNPLGVCSYSEPFRMEPKKGPKYIPLMLVSFIPSHRKGGM